MEMKKKSKNNILSLRKKKLNCPTCKKSSLDPFTPFCSKKCSDIDLIKWLSDEEDNNIEEYKNSS